MLHRAEPPQGPDPRNDTRHSPCCSGVTAPMAKFRPCLRPRDTGWGVHSEAVAPLKDPRRGG